MPRKSVPTVNAPPLPSLMEIVAKMLAIALKGNLGTINIFAMLTATVTAQIKGNRPEQQDCTYPMKPVDAEMILGWLLSVLQYGKMENGRVLPIKGGYCNRTI